MTRAVLEIGPAVVRSRCAAPIGPDMASAALAGIDDTTVLLEERPVAVADLWRRVVAVNVETGCKSLTVVHPSWWPRRRVECVMRAAETVVPDVRAIPRSVAVAGNGPATVVEIADDVVAISDPDRQLVLSSRTDDARDAARSIDAGPGGMVLIDAPPGVAGATEYARGVLDALRRRGIMAQLAETGDAPGPQPVTRHWRGTAIAVASVVVTLCVIGISVSRAHAPAPALDAVSIVEGRVTVRIPQDWTITRITAGPGSRRIQASSPTDPNVALHVAQSYVPGETLDRTAEVLHQAITEQPRGVFVDFNPADHRSGRPAVSYREIRTGRDIRWTVVLDGSTRISVGCQSAPGHEDTVAAVCARSIETAHESMGTESGS